MYNANHYDHHTFTQGQYTAISGRLYWMRHISYCSISCLLSSGFQAAGDTTAVTEQSYICTNAAHLICRRIYNDDCDCDTHQYMMLPRMVCICLHSTPLHHASVAFYNADFQHFSTRNITSETKYTNVPVVITCVY